MALFKNRLAKETSPYLLQHANNPVDWYPWGDEAFERAKNENKLVLISIGYSSCHWCHVMEHETFSDAEVANYMNSKYINIKVDREEHPEVDQIYMNAVQIINRSGGWPLNCFALPDGKPVYGGTYFNKENWLDIIKNLNDTWLNEQSRVLEVANELATSISGSEVITYKREQELADSPNLINYSNHIKRLLDSRNGGIKGAPKFPMPGFLDYLLEYGYFFPDEEVLNHVFFTLDKIANGGIYDHLGGGFARYSVDENWRIPHFEKMLYDNAQLISIYSKAYRIQSSDIYRTIVNQSISFLFDEMKSPLGGYYASYDADSEGKEGAYYTWTKQELESVLGGETELFSSAYGISAVGNFEDRNVIARCASDSQLKSIFSDDEYSIHKRLSKAKLKLLGIRQGREKPQLDDKIIVSWNGLVISALVDAYVTFNERRYFDSAMECASYIEKYHYKDGVLKRINCKDTISIDGMLDDYAFLANAYLSLYKVSLDENWLNKSEDLVKSAIAKFYDSSSGMFFYTPVNSKRLIARKMDLTDGVISSSSSVMAQVLFELGRIRNDDRFLQISSQMLVNIADNFENGGPYVYGWAKLMLKQLLPGAIISINAQNSQTILREIFEKTIYPSISISSANSNEITLCLNNTCNKPSANSLEIVENLNSVRVL